MKIIDNVELSDENVDVSPIVAFYVPFFEDNRDEIEKLVKRLTTNMFTCGYNLASIEEFNVEKQPIEGHNIAIM